MKNMQIRANPVAGATTEDTSLAMGTNARDSFDEALGDKKGHSALASLLKPAIDAATVPTRGEDAWHYLRDHFLKPDPPTLSDMKQMLARAEVALSRLSEDVDELELPMASIYLDAARATPTDRSVF